MPIRAVLAALLLAPMAMGATNLRVTLPANSTTGVSFSFTVTARNGTTTDPAYTGTVHFTSSDAAAVLPADTTFTLADAGTHTFTATMNTSGDFGSPVIHSITATDGPITGTGVTKVKWAPDIVTRFRIECPSAVDRTVVFPCAVSARNSDGNIVPTYIGTIHFKSTTGVVLPPDYTFTGADSGAHTFTFTANRGGQHVITAEDVDSPKTSGSTSFQVNCPELTVTAGNDGPVCADSTAVLWANSNQSDVTYYWSGARFWWAESQNAIAPSPGKYMVEVRNSVGCHVWTTTTVDTIPVQKPALAVSKNHICGDQTVTASVQNPTAFSNFNWTVDYGTIVSGQGTSSIEIMPENTNYDSNVSVFLFATDTAAGCSTYANYSAVSVDWVPDVDIVTPGTVCPGSINSATVQWYSDRSASYGWSITGGTIVEQSLYQIKYRPNGNGNVTLTATIEDLDGSCPGSDTVIVSVNGPKAHVDANLITACPGESSPIPFVLEGTPPFSVTWSDGVTQSNINNTSATRMVSPTQTTSYAITKVSDAHCTGTATGVAMVSVDTKPAIVRQPLGTIIARGSTAKLSIAARGSGLTYHWYRGTSGDRTQPVASGDSSSYTTPPLTATTAYWVDVVSSCGSIESATAVVSVSGRRRAVRP